MKCKKYFAQHYFPLEPPFIAFSSVFSQENAMTSGAGSQDIEMNQFLIHQLFDYLCIFDFNNR